jgi:acyl carrier protein
MREDNKEKLLQIITKALGLKEQISKDDSIQTIEEWDSLGHLEILAALDMEFEGRMASIQDLASATSVKEIFDILRREKLI